MTVEKMIGVERLAGWLGVPAKTVYWLNTEGRGPRRYRIGKEVRYKPSEVAEWIAAQAVPGPDGAVRGCGLKVENGRTERLISAGELAEWLGYDDVKSVYWLNTTGKGPQRYRIGKQVRYVPSEVPEWIAGRAVAGELPAA